MIRRRFMMPAVALTLLVASCTSTDGDSVPSSTSAPARPATSPGSLGRSDTTQDLYTLDAQHLAFALPGSFERRDGDFAFLARSPTPRAVFSIDADAPDIADVAARPGEVLATLDMPGVTAVVVTDAAIDGLPDGVIANELRVANGPASFSAIMSAGEEDLPELWERFVASIRVTPTD